MANSQVHGARTREWAREAGLSRAAAAAVARADAEVDLQGLPRHLYHMRPRLLLGPDRRGGVAAEHLRAAKEAASQGECEEVWRHLGRGLHALQDQSAHGGWWWLGIHWFPWFDELDRTMWGLRDRRQRRLKAVERVTKGYLYTALANAEVQSCSTREGGAATNGGG